MNPRMLPDVQRVQVQPEGAHLQNQRVHQRPRNPQPPVRAQRVPERFEVAHQLLHRAVSRQRPRQLVQVVPSLRQRIRHPRQRRARRSPRRSRMLHRPLHPDLQADREAPIILKLVLLPEDLRLWRMHLGHVGFQARPQLVAHPDLLCAGGQQVGDLIQLPLIKQEQVPSRQVNRVPRHLRRHKRVAVPVAPNPRPEYQHLGQTVRLHLHPVSRLESFGNLTVEPRQCRKNGHIVVVQPHLDLVVHRRPPRAHLVRLP